MIGNHSDYSKNENSKTFSSGQQQIPGYQRTFLGSYCQFMDNIFYCQHNKIRNNVERPLKAVVENWENQTVFCALILWKMKQELRNSLIVLVNGTLRRSCLKWNICRLLWLSFGCGLFFWRRYFCDNVFGFLILKPVLVFLEEQGMPSPPKKSS